MVFGVIFKFVAFLMAFLLVIVCGPFFVYLSETPQTAVDVSQVFGGSLETIFLSSSLLKGIGFFSFALGIWFFLLPLSLPLDILSRIPVIGHGFSMAGRVVKIIFAVIAVAIAAVITILFSLLIGLVHLIF